jgi:hypothetical protein
VTVVRIQCFSFGSRGEGSVTRHGGVTTSTGGNATLERGNEGDNVSWTDVNLTMPKNKENLRSRFNWYKCTVKI